MKTAAKHQNIWKCALFLCLACLSVAAQDVQFLPEIDVNFKLNSSLSMYLQAKDDRDGGDSSQLSLGPSLQLSLHPWIKLKNAKRFDLDDSKSRPLVFETGYRYLAAPDTPEENRWLLAVTAHFPMQRGFLLSNRSRADLDWKAGSFTWRFRNKLTLEKSVALHSCKFVPYIAAEPYYESQYQKWSTTALYAGLLLPIGRRLEFNTYYEHENNTGKQPNNQENFVGLALYIFFRQTK